MEAFLLRHTDVKTIPGQIAHLRARLKTRKRLMVSRKD